MKTLQIGIYFNRLKYILFLSIFIWVGLGIDISAQNSFQTNRNKLFIDNLKEIISDKRKRNAKIEEEIKTYTLLLYDPTPLKDLNKRLEIKQKQLNNYNLDLIEIGSNFLFLPYNEQGIRNIAIPALVEARDYSKYEQYSGRLDLLRNYKKNLTEVGSFLQDYLADTNSDPGEWITKAQKDFYSLKAVKDYQTLFGEGWEETFLGKIMNNILLTFEDSAFKDVDSIRANLQNYYTTIEPMMDPKPNNESKTEP